ncbi:MAG: AgmX/PglI C-terminal domain-containing protein [Deltaproteobacteria bacterium]|nr:AgmX/PglI C-terminal domain-containing protein [Deltaproteobacteria bacterium]
MARAKILAVAALVASSLALGGCDKIKEMIPAGILGGGDEAPSDEKEGDSKKGEDSKKEGDSKKEEGSKEEPAGEKEPPAEEEGGKEEKPAVEEEAPAEEKAATPAGDPAVKSDIPKSIKSRTKVEKVQVIGHTSEGGKYKFAAKKANPALKECHRSALVDKPGAVGKVKFKISLSGKGEVEAVDIEKNKTGSDDLAACCAGAFKALDWPKGKDGEDRVLAIPVMFKK